MTRGAITGGRGDRDAGAITGRREDRDAGCDHGVAEPGGGGAEPRRGRGTGRCVRMRRRLMAQGERYVREKVDYMIMGFETRTRTIYTSF